MIYSVASFKPSTYICCYLNQTLLFIISVTMYDDVDYSKFDWCVIPKSHVVTRVAMEMECVEITRGHTQHSKVAISHMILEGVKYVHHILPVQLWTAVMVVLKGCHAHAV